MTSKVSKPVTKQVTAIITKDKKLISEDHDNDVISIVEFETDRLASVSAKYGVTLNMGNFDMVRLDAMVTLPCYMEEVDSAMQCAAEKAEGFVREQAREYLVKRANDKKDKKDKKDK